MRRLEKIAEEYSKQNAELMEMIREYRVSIDHAADMLGVYAQGATQSGEHDRRG